MNGSGFLAHGAPPEGYAGPQRSLILAGGGMRVAYQAGVIRALLEAGLTFAHADGTSGGTINLAMLLSGLSPIEMCDRWRTLRVRDFVSFMPLEDYLKAWDMPALGDAKGIIRDVFPHLGIDVSKINGARGMKGTFNVCNYTRKTCEVIPHDQIDLDLLVAGVSLPIYMPPVQKGDCLYLDAVWIKDANLMEAVRRGSEELWVVWCIGNISEYKNGVFNQYVHMIEISANGNLFEEFTLINEINARIREGETVYGHTRPIRLHLIKPEYPLPLDPDFYLGHIDAATLIDMGYADAKRYLRGMQSDGLPFQPEVTKMRYERLGITFRERMEGGFSLGETDPQIGAEKGAGSALTLHTAMSIHDLRTFMSDPDHAGVMNGHMSFAPWGQDLPAKGGVFNLFSPPENPALTLVKYELALEQNGQEYYLAGRKEIHRGATSDLWKDLTTLYVQLHQGPNATGPVVGGGILRVSATDFASMVSSIHVTNAQSMTEQAQALGEFGRFFLGELWETYHAKVPG